MIGYDGVKYEVGDRVEVHPCTDVWMQGARYGVVIRTSLTPKDRVHVCLDRLPKHKFAGSEDTFKRIT